MHITDMARRAALVFALAASLIAATGACAAAHRAAELGPEVALSEPGGGYVGELTVSPSRGPAGTPVTVTGHGFPASQDLDLVWRTVKGRWKVTSAEYHGREYTPAAYRISTVKSDASGRISAAFAAPEDFGFLHDIIIEQRGRLLTQTAFSLEITARIVGADRGPVGTPIAIEVQGIGWRELEGSWVVLFDNRFTGFISAVTTNGTARFDLPATGHVGLHIVEIQHSDFGSPYRNTQQSPVAGRPDFKLRFTVTPGVPVLPPPPET